MSIFRRRRSPELPSPEAITAFWRWWDAEGARRCAQAVAAGDTASLERLIGPAVEALHPRLAWEFGPGARSEHVLVVTCAGDPELRATARRWLLGAPPPDAVWEYSDSRTAVGDFESAQLQFNGRTVAFTDMRAGWQVDEDRAAIDVQVYHPAFAAMDETTRAEITFLVADSVLGEEAVETWVGEIGPVVHEPAGATNLAGLRTAVLSLAEEYSGNEPTWRLLEGRTPSGQVVIAMARVPLVSAVAPQLDGHLRVELPYAPDEAGLPAAGALDDLRAVEERVEALVGTDGRVVAHETTGGSRTLHVYVDRTTDAADRVAAALDGYPPGNARSSLTHDPEWRTVAHLRG